MKLKKKIVDNWHLGATALIGAANLFVGVYTNSLMNLGMGLFIFASLIWYLRSIE